MRAKFLAESVSNHASGNTVVNLAPVLKSTEENKSFWQATPNGKLEMCITNPKATEFFKAGVEYYVDFTPATSQE
ncbi:hypothetical protein [Nostoc sp.]|uniref:hypothetical protein n=1 Tax=Nostoc sp. TaxID=1180 RepID=UPI002FF2E97F